MTTAPRDAFYQLRLEAVAKKLRKNGFAVHLASSADEAKSIILGTLIPTLAPRSIAFGGSMSLVDTGIYAAIKAQTQAAIIDTLDRSIPPSDLYERRRQALLADLFLMGTNAVTEAGHLVNLDMLGNRVAALHFGPRNVIVLAGRNKLVPDVDAAQSRIKYLAAPANALRLAMPTPCTTTGKCAECASPQRICNVWTITERCYPEGRIHVVLTNADLGL
jgi:L-lactate utilization protein LutB